MLTMNRIAAITAGLAIVLAVAGCASTPENDAPQTSSPEAATSRTTPSTTPAPVTVIVPDASVGIAAEVSKMVELGLDVTVTDAKGEDVTSHFTDPDFGADAVFVSQKPAGGAEVDDGAAVAVKVRDPKVVVSADFSGPGGSITSLDGSALSQITDAPQHWEKEVPYGSTTDYTFTNPYAAGTLTCKVTQEGEVVQTNTASGPFASTNC